MACKLEVSSHWFEKGRTGTISKTTNLADVGWDDDIDAYRLKGDCSNTLVTLYQHPPSNGGSGWTFPVNAYETWFGNSNKGWGEHRAFKNQMSHVSFRKVPKRDYWQDMDIVGNIGDWWFHFGNDRKTEDDPTAQEGFCLWGGEGTANGSGCTRGKPCPGGSMHMINSRKVRCYYKKASEIRELRRTINNTPSKDPRKTMSYKIKEKFCADPENIFENPGGGTCREYDAGKKLAREYCRVGHRMSKDGNCTKESLGGLYESTAAAYCKSTGKKEPWCSCYNVMNKVCRKDASAAGCAKKKSTFDELVAATPKKFRNSWNGMEACFGGVCAGDKYLPTGYNANCSRPVQVCVQEFNINAIADSKINATCDQKSGSSSTGEGSSSTSSGSGGGSKSNNPLIYGGGGFAGLSVSSLCCCLIIILLMFM